MEYLAQIREELGYSQQDIADAVNVDRTTVSKWETGIAKPRASKLLTLSNFLGCSIEKLLGSQ